LAAIAEALPLRPGIRILEIGCGTGLLARELISRCPDVHVLAIDRSSKAIGKAMEASAAEIATGRLTYRTVAVECFKLLPGESRFDIAIAVRVGALDGRHPELGSLALPRIAKALTSCGTLFIDGGSPLRELSLDSYR